MTILDTIKDNKVAIGAVAGVVVVGAVAYALTRPAKPSTPSKSDHSSTVAAVPLAASAENATKKEEPAKSAAPAEQQQQAQQQQQQVQQQRQAQKVQLQPEVASPSSGASVAVAAGSSSASSASSSSSSSAASGVAADAPKPASEKKKAKKKEEKVLGQNYRNGILGVSLQFSEDWIKEENPTPGVPVKLVRSNANGVDDESVPQIVLTVEDLPADMSVEQYCENSKQSMVQTVGQFGELQFLSQEKIKLGDRDALLLVHTQQFKMVPMLDASGNQILGELKLKQCSMITVSRKRAFSLQYVASFDAYQSCQSDAIAVLKSLRVDTDSAVLSIQDVAQLSMVRFEDRLSGFGITVPASLHVRIAPQEGIVAAFVKDDAPFFSVSLTTTVLDDEQTSKLSLKEFTALNKARIREFMSRAAVSNIRLMDDDKELKIAGGMEATMFTYMQDTMQTAYVQFFDNVEGDKRRAYGVVVSMLAVEFLRNRVLINAILESVKLVPRLDEAAAASSLDGGVSLVYLNRRYGIEASVPVGFEILEETMPGNIVTFAGIPSDLAASMNSGMGMSPVNILQLHIMVESFPMPLTLDELEAHLKKLSSEFSPSRTPPTYFNESDVAVGGHPGREFWFKHVVAPDVELWYLNRCTVRGKQAYYLQFGAIEKLFQAAKDDAIRCMNSFKTS
eukprot:ANDGO_00879.mRNA.1 hypothetical protein